MRLRLILWVILLCTYTAWAQDSSSNYTSFKDSSRLDIGVKGGINFAELLGDDALPDSRYKIGYSVGFYVGTPIKKNWYFFSEFVWSLQGEKSKKSGQYALSYFNVPLMFKWKKKGFYAEAGPQLSFLVNSRSEDVPEVLRVLDYETFELSAAAGIGYKIWEDLAIGIRYTLGLTPLVKDLDIRTNVLYIGLSYRVF